ncbi:MAG TPA: diacylglycerol kinase family protein [Chitinophagaceae bacterium]|nr:diacylglycerol kinase family protein [Chitinophagaceae bacterium]
MQKDQTLKLLFVVNPVSGGRSKINWENRIREFFKPLPHTIEFFILSGTSDGSSLQHHISRFGPDRVVAVGGDGTIKAVGEQLLGSNTPLGIIPAGSANGMAKELELPIDLEKNLDIILNGEVKRIDVIRVNDKEISLHLSDLGLNALLIKYYEKNKGRGKWGYFKAVFRTLWEKQLMDVRIIGHGMNQRRKAFMIVLANASKYGTGALINPQGSLYDGEFELIIVRRLALMELIKMLVQHREFNRHKIDIIKVKEVTLIPSKKSYFQVDGEYRGKLNKIQAAVMPAVLPIMLPQKPKS